MSALPPTGFAGRWTPHRKQAVADSVRGGALSIADAIKAYDLSAEELASWLHRASNGRAALRVTRR